MPAEVRKSRMFEIDGQRMRTWNVLHGCRFACRYCSVRSLVETRLQAAPKYARGMEPGIAEREIKKNFKPGEWVFVGYMGDVTWQPMAHVRLVLEKIEAQPEVNFYFQSKDPGCFIGWLQCYHPVFPPNVTFGTTIETNRMHTVSLAPWTVDRFEAMARLRAMGRRTMVSIEPVMDFDLTTLMVWLSYLEPEYIFLGADNYGHHLPEPSAGKLEALIAIIKALPNPGTTLILKPGLQRLLG